MNTLKGTTKVILLATLTFSGASLAAPLTNGDFGSFDGWTATKTNEDPPGTFNTVTLTGEAGIGADAQFVRGSPAAGFADMSNDPVNPAGYYEVTLHQEFDLPANALALTFDFDWKVSDITVDLIQASLWTAGFGTFLEDLLGNVTVGATDHARSGGTGVDISAYAGQTVVMEFLLQDGDFTGSPLLGGQADSFGVGNIMVTEAQTPVPAPAPLALLALGMLGFPVARKLTSGMRNRQDGDPHGSAGYRPRRLPFGSNRICTQATGSAAVIGNA